MQAHHRIIWETTLVGLMMGGLWSAAAGDLDRYAKDPDVQTCINREKAAKVQIKACTRFIKSLEGKTYPGRLMQAERGLAYVKSGQIHDAAADYSATLNAAQLDAAPCGGYKWSPGNIHISRKQPWEPLELRHVREELKKAILSHPKVSPEVVHDVDLHEQNSCSRTRVR